MLRSAIDRRIRGRDHSLDGGVKILAGVSFDPGLVGVAWLGAGVDVASHFRIDPEAREKGPEQDLVGLGICGCEKIGYIMVASRRKWSSGESLGRNAELLEERPVKCPLDDNRDLGRLGGEIVVGVDR